MSTKPCRDCGEVKPLDEFNKDAKAKDGRRAYCKPCHSARSMSWEKANPEKRAKSVRRHNLKRRYGITVEQFDELFAKQGGRCACCGAPEPGGTGWQVDHCHDSNELRGILCHSCNVGIGHLGDNVDGVWQAMLYLVKHEQKEMTA